MANEKVELYKKAKKLNSKLEVQILSLMFFTIIFSFYTAIFLYDILFVGMSFSIFLGYFFIWLFILVMLTDSIRSVKETYDELQKVERELLEKLEE
ncbi:MAG: hypothetical protein ABGW69_02180 [Nanoarchaeota archaeon]